jgi:Domain of unknown function (DUF4402)
MRINVALAALAASMLTATPALAASASAQANAKGTVLKSLTLTAVSDLDFGTVAGDATTLGHVLVNADTGLRSTTGGVVALAGGFGRAQFNGLGDPNATVTLTLGQPAGNVICTAGCAATIPAALSLNSGGTTRVTDSTGKLTVFVGGDFTIAANQQQGVYTAQFDLTVNY